MFRQQSIEWEHEDSFSQRNKTTWEGVQKDKKKNKKIEYSSTPAFSKETEDSCDRRPSTSVALTVERELHGLRSKMDQSDAERDMEFLYELELARKIFEGIIDSKKRPSYLEKLSRYSLHSAITKNEQSWQDKS
jgi:hypothetical protein